MPADPSRTPILLLAAVVAAAAPSLLAYNVSPSPTFLNQALALGTWGGFALLLAAGQRSAAGFAASRAAAPVQLALALIAAAALWSGTAGALPSSLCLSALGLLGAAALLVHSGSAACSSDEAGDLFALFSWGFLIAGGLNLAIGLVQVFAPGLADGDWIAVSNITGRAVGNLRQPNHLSSLLLWAAIGAVALLEMRRLGRRAAAAALALLVFAVVLTASRTGLVSVLLLAFWGAADRRLARFTRVLLLAAPLVYAVAWLGMAQWAAASSHAFGGAARLAESDISGSRFGIWANTLELIRQHPWAGVGFGEFNLAWTLTPFPGRPVAFFDHTHNLPLQLAAELGLPLAAVVMALLLWALARGLRGAWAAPGDEGMARRAAMGMVLMIGLHSLLEYPLWYGYFLLPAAWAWGFALHPAQPAARRDLRAPWLVWAGAALVVAAVLSVADYARVAVIFSARPGLPPLEQRIAEGRRSVLFGHHADYAAVTSGVPVLDEARAFDRATHYLLDTRLMMAWSRALAEQGRLDEARHLAARLREFRKPEAEGFFGVCEAVTDEADASASAPPFQCDQPKRSLSWRELLSAGDR